MPQENAASDIWIVRTKLPSTREQHLTDADVDADVGWGFRSLYGGPPYLPSGHSQDANSIA
jgi:hypothetical protein